MKRKSTIELESLAQDEVISHLMKDNLFLDDQYIEDLCRDQPGNEESIRLAVKLMRYYRKENPDVEDAKIEAMWNDILLKSKTPKRSRLIRLNLAWRIAASVAILFSLTFYFFEYSSNHSIRKFAQTGVVAGDEARIILSDGSGYPLKANDSHIHYNSDGKEIVIEEKNNQAERVHNQASGTKSIYNQIVIPFGKRHSVTLSDGTVVQLNSGSKLVFPAIFSDVRREVFLEGEGYFEVAKDVKKPFIINTDLMNVKVLGTHFNISAYQNEKPASVVLVEGSVEVYNNNLFNNHLCKIKPGQGCFISDDVSGFKVLDVDVNEYVSWKDGFFQFSDQPLGSIAKKVEKYYNKSIIIPDDDLSNRMISGKLVIAASLEETLDFLARTTKSQYILKEDGTYHFIK